MILTKEQKQTVIDGVQKCIDRANEYYKPTTPFRMPSINYTLRGGVAANANSGAWALNFNLVLLIENWEDMIKNTIPHEVAHLIDQGHIQRDANSMRRIVMTRRGYRREKRSVHGDSWKAVMRVFGVKEHEITRCHQYDMTNARVKEIKRYEYKCGCAKPCVAGPKHHKRIMLGLSRPWCKRCRVVLSPETFMGKKETLPAAPKPVVIKQPFIGQATAPAPTPPKVVRAGTKLDYAMTVLATHKDLTRQQFISMMMRDQNMSFAGAQTYYYSALKALKSECKAA